MVISVTFVQNKNIKILTTYFTSTDKVMKKRLEAELISIAHRVLKLKNKSEVDQLYHETQKLYEALTVLKFYGDNYEQFKSEISEEDLEEKLTASLEEKAPEIVEIKAEPVVEVAEVTAEVEEEVTVEEQIVEAAAETPEEIVAEEEVEEKITEEPVIVGEITLDEEDEMEEEVPVGEAKSDLDFEPIFELAAETPIEEKIETPKSEAKQISFEELLGENYSEPVFVKPNDVTIPTPKKEIAEETTEVAFEKFDSKPLSLNDKLSKTINIGLNDRMAFVKNLFGDSTEDYNRVLSQLNTFSTYAEAKDFIDEIIKPDYNNWEGQDEFAERFLGIVENKFN